MKIPTVRGLGKFNPRLGLFLSWIRDFENERAVDLHGRSNTRDFEIFELITFSGSI